MEENDTKQFGEYELLALIGDGAQGRVYKARCVTDAAAHVKQGEVVALKIVHIASEDEKLRLKFVAQAELLRGLSHENIVSYRDCFTWHAGEWDEAQCLVIELLEGETLQECLKKEKSGLPWPQVDEIVRQCLAGLVYAREHGVTHRDIKPSNIFITRDGKAKLIDFDIARQDDSDQKSTAGWKGTFDYMAPDFVSIDEFRGDEVSDIFSMGVCFYEALTGSLPYEPLGDMAHIGYLNRWRNNAAPAPSFRPGVFRVLSNAKQVVAKCLAPKREERYATFASLLEDFGKIRYRRVCHKNKDEYELLAVLGRGGFGEVFKARRVSDGMLVAVKYLFSEKQSERFVKEAKILQQYSHPNLVKYVDFMVLEGTGGEKQFFLVMEYLEGMPGWTLRPRLKSEGRLAMAEVVPLFRSYLKALQFLHENPRPIIHRDIKPGNLYAPVGQPEKGKVFDLGVARDVSGTVTVGGIPGTLDYMAPEFGEASGDRGSPQSDLYALGLCLYEAVTGKPAYGRLPTDFSSAWLAFQERLRNPPVVAFDDDVFVRYPQLKDVILKAIANKPVARYRSASEMRKALDETLRDEKTGSGQSVDDSVDVTLSTLVGGGGAAEKPSAAPETRPIERVGGDSSDKDGQLVTGGQEAVRGKKRKVIMFAGGAVAALMVIGLGGLWLGTRPGGRASGPAEQARQPDARPKETLAEAHKPVPPDTQKPALSEVAKPAVTGVTPPKAEQEPVTLPPERDPVYLGLKNTIPERITSDADWAAAEAAAAQLVAQEKLPWPGVDDAEKARRLAALRATLTERAAAYVAQVSNAVLAAYAADKVAKDDRERLSLMAKKAPLLKDWAAVPFDEAVKRVGSAEAKAAQAAADRLKRVADATQRLDELSARIQKGALADCSDGVALLAGFAPDLLANADFKVKWDAARGAYVKLVEQTLALKDPLEQRAQRLKTAEEVLGHASANTIFAAAAESLRKTLDQQKGVCLLMLVNRSKNAVQVSGHEIKETVGLSGGEMKELALPVTGEALAVSILVDGGNRFRSRVDTVRLLRSGGVEWAMGALEAEPVKPVEPPVVTLASSALTNLPAAAGNTSTPPPVVSASHVSARPAVAPASSASAPPTASGGTALDITVSPRDALVSVDDKTVTAGSAVEVTPNENHKVTVECVGYKSVQQYYKVRPGETRKIDILLEKERKRTFFRSVR